MHDIRVIDVMESPMEQEPQETSNKRENEEVLVPVLVKSHKEKSPGRDIQINCDIVSILLNK